MNRFSLFFLAFLLTIAFFSSFQFVSSFVYYKAHSTALPGKISQWKVSETPGQKFVITAFYTYIFQEKSIKAEAVFPKQFANSAVALETLKDFSKRKWFVWVKATGKDPILNRNFPLKEMIQSLLSLGVFLYFVFFRKIYQT